jgi:hypothetical protein
LGLQLLTFLHGGNLSGDSQFEGLLKTALRQSCTGLIGQELADATQDFRMHVGRHLAKRFLATSCHGTYTQLADSIARRTDHQTTLQAWLVAEAKPKTDAEAQAEAMLQIAARCNHSGVVHLLVFKGAKDVSGALVYAARYGDLELCKFLIEHKGPVHHDNGDATPLLAAVRNGHV